MKESISAVKQERELRVEYNLLIIFKCFKICTCHAMQCNAHSKTKQNLKMKLERSLYSRGNVCASHYVDHFLLETLKII